MGPEDGIKQSAHFTKPPYFIEHDFQLWRKLVADWVAMMKEAHDKGADRSLKTQYNILGRIIYS